MSLICSVKRVALLEEDLGQQRVGVASSSALSREV